MPLTFMLPDAIRLDLLDAVALYTAHYGAQKGDQIVLPDLIGLSDLMLVALRQSLRRRCERAAVKRLLQRVKELSPVYVLEALEPVMPLDAEGYDHIIQPEAGVEALTRYLGLTFDARLSARDEPPVPAFCLHSSAATAEVLSEVLRLGEDGFYDRFEPDNGYFILWDRDLQRHRGDHIREVFAEEKEPCSGTPRELDRPTAAALLTELLHRCPVTDYAKRTSAVEVRCPAAEARTRAELLLSHCGPAARYFTSVRDPAAPYSDEGYGELTDEADGNCFGYKVASLTIYLSGELIYLSNRWDGWHE